MKYIVPIGRFLYSFIFLITIMNQFSPQAIAFAVLSGLPVAEVLVPLSGILAILGAISIILGYKAKLGAWFIILFLIPVTFYMHPFWNETDSLKWQIQLVDFMKNISMIGAALLITYFGSGPLSIDLKNKKKS
jgi:putative oxidoreductase